MESTIAFILALIIGYYLPKELDLKKGKIRNITIIVCTVYFSLGILYELIYGEERMHPDTLVSVYLGRVFGAAIYHYLIGLIVLASTFYFNAKAQLKK